VCAVFNETNFRQVKHNSVSIYEIRNGNINIYLNLIRDALIEFKPPSLKGWRKRSVLHEYIRIQNEYLIYTNFIMNIFINIYNNNIVYKLKKLTTTIIL
jgi:hypothetical protein